MNGSTIVRESATEMHRILAETYGDPSLAPHGVANAIGNGFFFSTDFPHEVNVDMYRREIEAVIDSPELSDANEEAILGGNSSRFYGLDWPPSL